MSTVLATVPPPLAARRDLLWEHTRNNLGIARLLLRERRPEPLVGTALSMALETAVRTALDQTGRTYDGRPESALELLEAPAELMVPLEGTLQNQLAETERRIAWVSGYLRRVSPHKSWGF